MFVSSIFISHFLHYGCLFSSCAKYPVWDTQYYYTPLAWDPRSLQSQKNRYQMVPLFNHKILIYLYKHYYSYIYIYIYSYYSITINNIFLSTLSTPPPSKGTKSRPQPGLQRRLSDPGALRQHEVAPLLPPRAPVTQHARN